MTLHQNRLQQSSGNNQKRAERLFFYSFINNILGIGKLDTKELLLSISHEKYHVYYSIDSGFCL